MGTNAVIDLLSSDDEAPSTFSNPAKAIAPIKATATSTVLLTATEISNSTQIGEQWEEAPSKRRKLSPSPISEDDTYGFPELPRPRTMLPRVDVSRNQLRKEQVWATLDEDDPIVFTSSLSKIVQPKARASASDASDDSLPEDLFSATSLARPSALSTRTAALLDSLSQPSRPAKLPSVRKRFDDRSSKKPSGRSRRSAEDGNSSASEDNATAPGNPTKASKRPKLTEEAKAAQAREKEREKTLKTKEKEKTKAANKKQKAKEKEEDQERKRLLKEEKAREKRIAVDLAEVNKSKLDKKDSTPEMIVDLPASIDGERVDTQIREFLKNLGVDATLYQSPVPNIIRWRRKMKARWNAELDYWEPIERMEIHEEKHVLCIMSAREFIALAMALEDDEDVETHVARLKSAYVGCTPIYIIEGLHTAMKKSKTAENRAYQAKVNSVGQAGDVQSTTQTTSRKKPAAEVINEDSIEDALLRLQVMNGCFIHHTATSVETAEWVATFTQYISTIPYR